MDAYSGFLQLVSCSELSVVIICNDAHLAVWAVLYLDLDEHQQAQLQVSMTKDKEIRVKICIIFICNII